MILKTKFEFIIEHIAPLDPEKLGEALSQVTRPIMDNNPNFKGRIRRTTVNILGYNEPSK